MKLTNFKYVNVYTYNYKDRTKINSLLSNPKLFILINNSSSNVPNYWSYIQNVLNKFKIYM